MSMERVHELANAPEPPDEPEPVADPDEHDPSPEPPPEDVAGGDAAGDAPAPPAAPKSEKEIEKAIERLGKEAARHRDRLGQIMGEDAADLSPCPLCDSTTAGWLWPLEAMQPRDELHARLLDVLASGPSPEYQSAKDKSTCPDCDGWGMTSTGSRAPGQQALPCAGCNGHGWVTTGRAAPVASLVPPIGESPVIEYSGPQPQSIPDAWGRPSSHPDYGRDPALVNG